MSRFGIAGTPMNWQDDVGGQVSSAMMAYLQGSVTADQLKLVIAYCQHHIHAPCWTNPIFGDEVGPEMIEEIEALRQMSLEMKTVEDVHQFVSKALESAIDPL